MAVAILSVFDMTPFTFLVEAEVWLRIFDLLVDYETELSFNDGTNYLTRSRQKDMRSTVENKCDSF